MHGTSLLNVFNSQLAKYLLGTDHVPGVTWVLGLQPQASQSLVLTSLLSIGRDWQANMAPFQVMAHAGDENRARRWWGLFFLCPLLFGVNFQMYNNKNLWCYVGVWFHASLQGAWFPQPHLGKPGSFSRLGVPLCPWPFSESRVCGSVPSPSPNHTSHTVYPASSFLCLSQMMGTFAFPYMQLSQLVDVHRISFLTQVFDCDYTYS